MTSNGCADIAVFYVAGKLYRGKKFNPNQNQGQNQSSKKQQPKKEAQKLKQQEEPKKRKAEEPENTTNKKAKQALSVEDAAKNVLGQGVSRGSVHSLRAAPRLPAQLTCHCDGPHTGPDHQGTAQGSAR